jgi:hypothetical protein
MYIRKLYNKSVHLPLIFGYGTCSEKNIVNRIISYKYGLDKKINIDLSGKIYNDKELWVESNNLDKKYIFSSNIATLGELFSYIYYSKNKDGSVVLPNGIKCNNISELYDYICISYLATHQLLNENNIFPSDMHPGNIFIHWLNDNSYYNGENIKNIKEIIYKVNNKYYKIKTFGFVIILGDTGTFIINVKKDVIIVGQIWDIHKNYKLIKRRIQPEFTNTNFLFWNKNYLTPYEFNNTICFKILNSEPYCSYPTYFWNYFGWDVSYINNLKSTIELLEFYYKKYGVDKYIKNKNNILIDIN